MSMKNPSLPMPFSKRRRKSWVGCLTLGLVSLILLVAVLFYPVENWRGKRAWEKCKRELAAKGESVNWDDFLPTPVPDAQNFYKAPRMTEWFVGRATNDLMCRLDESHFSAPPQQSNAASAYLSWSDRVKTEFDTIRSALKRPCAQMDGGYTNPATAPIPNYKCLKLVSEVLQRRAKAALLLGKSDDALRDLILLHELGRMLEGRPTGRPTPFVTPVLHCVLVSAQIDVIADGLHRHAWDEDQLVAIQRQLAEINLLHQTAEGLRSERAALLQTFEIARSKGTDALRPLRETQGRKGAPGSLGLRLIPRGWWEQNYTFTARTFQTAIESIDLTNSVMRCDKLAAFDSTLMNLKKFNPYTFLPMLGIPNFSRGVFFAAYNQTLVNQAQIACALERHRLSTGHYPASLGALQSRLLEKQPRDLMNGHPLNYRLTHDGGFLLYSVGRDGVDDGGVATAKNGVAVELANGDWVWGQFRHE